MNYRFRLYRYYLLRLNLIKKGVINMKFKNKLLIMFMVILLVFLPVTIALADITYDIASSVELKKIGMSFEKVRKKSDQDLVVFEIKIKNIDNNPHLYRITAIIPGISGAQGHIPEKGEEKLAPQAEGTTFVGILTPEFPRDFEIIIEEVEAR